MNHRRLIHCPPGSGRPALSCPPLRSPSARPTTHLAAPWRPRKTLRRTIISCVWLDRFHSPTHRFRRASNEARHCRFRRSRWSADRACSNESPRLLRSCPCHFPFRHRGNESVENPPIEESEVLSYITKTPHCLASNGCLAKRVFIK